MSEHKPSRSPIRDLISRTSFFLALVLAVGAVVFDRNLIVDGFSLAASAVQAHARTTMPVADLASMGGVGLAVTILVLLIVSLFARSKRGLHL